MIFSHLEVSNVQWFLMFLSNELYNGFLIFDFLLTDLWTIQYFTGYNLWNEYKVNVILVINN